MIDRDVLERKIQDAKDCLGNTVDDLPRYLAVGVMQMFLKDMPTIDPVKHGRWIEHKGGDDYIGYPIYECSECGYDAGETATNYCPNCGALMREDGEEGWLNG